MTKHKRRGKEDNIRNTKRKINRHRAGLKYQNILLSGYANRFENLGNRKKILNEFPLKKDRK